MDEFVRRQPGSPIAGGFDPGAPQVLGRLLPEGQQAGYRGPVRSLLVAENHLRIAEEVQPGDLRRPAEESLKPVPVELACFGCEYRLLVEDVATAAVLEEAREFRGVEIALRGPDPQVIAPAGRPVDVNPSRHAGEQHMKVLAGGAAQNFVAQPRSNRRYAVVRGHVDKPGLHLPDPISRKSRNLSGVIHSQHHGAAVGVREGDQFCGEIVGVRGRHTSRSEPDLLELGAAVLTRAALAEDLVGRVEHGSGRVSAASASWCCTRKGVRRRGEGRCHPAHDPHPGVPGRAAAPCNSVGDSAP